MWKVLLTRLETELASGNWRTASYTVDGVTRQFATLGEFKDFYNWVKFKADEEDGITHRRVCMRPADHD